MIKEALQFLKDNQISIEEKEFHGRKFTHDKWNLIPNTFPEPLPTTLKVHTLSGLVDFIKSEKDIQDAIVHVVNHQEVRVLSDLFGSELQRKTWALATTQEIMSNGFNFDRYMEIPEFIVNLQSKFIQTEEMTNLLNFVSNIKVENNQNFNDSGVSQSVTIRKSTGSSLVKTAQIPNPVELKPFRTFLEVDQPKSSFVFRLSGGSEDAPLCALYDASGGFWKLDAIQKIADWLAVNLHDCGKNISIIA